MTILPIDIKELGATGGLAKAGWNKSKGLICLPNAKKGPRKAPSD
jgi:hypothetical protein